MVKKAHLALILFMVAGGCQNTGPSGITLKISDIQPASGSTFGGTAITLIGEGFQQGLAVTIGDVPATDVVVVDPNTATARTGQRAAAVVDVSVALAGRGVSLPAAFSYVAPAPGVNDPPVIENIIVQGMRLNQPAAMADLGEFIAVSALVSNAEVPPDSLRYEWTATSGTFEGTGINVVWKAPETLSATPADATISLTVVEPYLVPGAEGLPEAREHRVTRTATVRVHDSGREISDLATTFLELFSDSTRSPSRVVADFTESCGGRESELHDVRRNRCVYTINSSRIRTPDTPSINFRGVCPLGRSADACTAVDVRWVSTVNAEANSCPKELIGNEVYVPGAVEVTEGVDYVTAIYENRRWRLCDSNFVGDGGGASLFKK